MTWAFCRGCLNKQRQIDDLKEEIVRLKGKLRHQERSAKEGFFGSSTPSSKVPLKPNTLAERQAQIVADLDPTKGDVHYVLFDVARQTGDRPTAVREAGEYLKTGKNTVWKRAVEGFLKEP